MRITRFRKHKERHIFRFWYIWLRSRWKCLGPKWSSAGWDGSTRKMHWKWWASILWVTGCKLDTLLRWLKPSLKLLYKSKTTFPNQTLPLKISSLSPSLCLISYQCACPFTVVTQSFTPNSKTSLESSSTTTLPLYECQKTQKSSGRKHPQCGPKWLSKKNCRNMKTYKQIAITRAKWWNQPKLVRKDWRTLATHAIWTLSCKLCIRSKSIARSC